MARSTYIYVVVYNERVGISLPVLARTVKYELANAMTNFLPDALADMEVWRVGDDGSAYIADTRKYLGTGTEFLAAEGLDPSPTTVSTTPPFPVSEVRAALEKLDGTTASAVALLTGETREQLDELGGFGAA